MSKSKKKIAEPRLLTPKQVGDQLHAYLTNPALAAYFAALALAKSSPVAALLDELALGDLVRIELNVPPDSENEDAKKTWECCELARDAKTSMKANYWLRQAMVCSKDFMLWDHSIKGATFSRGKPKGSLGPVAKKIRAYLKKNSLAKPPEVWAALKTSPPKGFEFMENDRFGKYIEQGCITVMNWPRFRNLVSEHRPSK